MEIRKGRFSPPRGMFSGEAGEQDDGSATGVLARIRAMLGGASLEASPAAAPVSAATRDRPTEERRTKRKADLEADVKIREENNDLRRQLAESQGRVRALLEELGARAKSGSPKPYKGVSGQDHEKIMAFIRKHELDPGEDYDRALMGLMSTGQIRASR